MKIANKVMIVTGGGNGIGRQIVMEALKRGASVAAVDINAAALEETRQLAGQHADRLSTHRVDITDAAAVASLLDEAIQQHGCVDGVINCAGIIQPFIKLDQFPTSQIRKIMDVNFYGTVNILKTLLPYLLTRPEAHIANISSMGGFFPVPGQTIYGASKAAVKVLSEGLAVELRHTHVGVTIVIPGGVETNIIENSGSQRNQKMEKLRTLIPLLSPERAARAIIGGVEHNRHLMYLGFDAKIMRIAYILFPKLSAVMFSAVTSGILFDEP